MHSQPQTGVLTFVFTDLESSTVRWEHSPDAMAQALATHDRLVGEALARHGGSVFKRVGDAFCCAFASPSDAIAAAIEMQRELARQPWERTLGELRVRVGVHSGTALSRDGDYFGPALNRVARLTAAAHGSQILLSGAAAALVRDHLPDGVRLHNLGSHRLRDLANAETIFQLQAADLAAEFPPLRTLDARPNNLPEELSSFIGRDIELRELRELTASQRLVTICGPGGIGKTRLALQTAAELLDDNEDGVWFVPLAPVTDPEAVMPAIARVAGAGEAAGEEVSVTLMRHLAGKRVLLVIDNAEHLLAGVAAAVRTLLTGANTVHVLVTSRESLHVRGEQVYRLGPLEGPEAERFFVERAQSINRAFNPTPADAADLRAVTQALEGIPLAIELAAARTATLSLKQIRERLGEQLAFLRSQSSGDDRHRTLRETIAWSYELLATREREFLGELAVYSDGFTLDACEVLDPNALDLLEALVDKSFLFVNRGRIENRYAMLDVIAEFACERTDPQTIERAREEHFRFFSQVAMRGIQVLPGDDLAEWVSVVDADASNIDTALAFAFDRGREELGPMLLGLFRYWYIRRRIKDGRAWLRRYITPERERDPEFGEALRRASAFASIEGDYDEADALAKRSLTISHARADEDGILGALHALAVNENRRGNYSGAEKLYGDIASRCAQTGYDRAGVTSNANCAAIKMQRGDLDGAEALLAACGEAADRLGDEDVLATITALHGTLAYKRGEWQKAQDYFEHALRVKRELKNDFGVAEILAALSAVCVRLDRVKEAVALASEGLAIAVGIDSPPLAICALETAAYAACANGDGEGARDAFALSIAMRRIHSVSERIALERESTQAQLRDRFGHSFDDAAELASAQEWREASRVIVARLRETEASPIS